VVGARGFIGAYLTKFLLAKRVGPLRLFVRTTPHDVALAGTDVFCGDLLSREDCERFADGVKVIYYLAHTSSPVDSDRDWPGDALNNLIPLLNLLEAIQAAKTKPHIVYFSSGGALYAPAPARIPYVETDPCAPVSSYGIQKLAGEYYLRLAARRGHVTATALRVGNAFGTQLPEHRLQGLIGVAVNNIVHGRPVRVFGSLSNVRDYIHLEDISAIAEIVAQPREDFSIINVGSSVGHSVEEVLQIVESCYGRPIQFEAAEIDGQGLTDWVILDNSKAKREFGWAPVIDLRSGINEMLARLPKELKLGVSIR
jgi:UDP-glucose 4-epimerase